MDLSREAVQKRVTSFIDGWFRVSKGRNTPYSNFTDDSKDLLINRIGDPAMLRVFETFSDNLRDSARLHLKPNRFKTMGRVTKYKKYKFEAIDGKVHESHTKVDLTHMNLKKIIKESRNNKETILPLPINSVSKIIGVWHGRPKVDANSRVYDKDYLIQTFINECRPDIAAEMEAKGHIAIFKGTWSHNFQNLVDMCTEPKAEVSIDSLVDAMFSRVGIDFNLPYIGKLPTDVILGLPTNPKSTSGLVTSTKVTKMRKLSVKYTKFPAYVYAGMIRNSKKQVLDTSLYSIGGREKRVTWSIGKSHKKLKTRAVFMQEDVPTLIGQGIASMINREVQRHNKGHNWGGRINGRQNWKKVVSEMKINEGEGNFVNVNVDFSGHDNHTTENQIVVAWAFLRLMFEEDEGIDKLFYYSMSSMICKRVVLPESNLIYQIEKGIPSGHSLTSQITTLCAYNIVALALKECIKDQAVLSKTWISNAGDDTFVKLPVEVLASIDKYIQEMTPMKVDSFSDNSGLFDSNNVIIRNTFLKKKYNSENFSWNDLELFTNLLHPTMKGKGWGTRIDNLRQMILQAPLDNNLNKDISAIIIMTYFKKFLSENIAHTKVNGLNNIHPLNFIKHYKNNRHSSLYEIVNSYTYTEKIRSYWPLYGAVVQYDMKAFLLDKVLALEKDIMAKKIWFTSYRPLLMHESVHRIAAFDAAKITVKAHIYNVLDYPNLIYDDSNIYNYDTS